MIDLRGAIEAAIIARGEGAQAALARAVCVRLETPGRVDGVQSQISRFRKGARADGFAASLPLPLLEIVLDELGLEIVPRS